MKTKAFLLMAVMMLLPLSMTAQRIQQKLGRGVVAVQRVATSRTGSGGSGALISWRKLAQEPEGTTYNVYRRTGRNGSYTKMNDAPLTVTNYTPASLTANTEYAVSAIVNGVEGEISNPFLYKAPAWSNVWFDFDFDDTVIKRDDYRTKFVWPMDLNGNGEVDAVVVDRLYSGSSSGEEEDDAENTATTSHKIQAYKLDGTLLWTVDMGPNVNICAGQNDMVLAYDIDCDGRCEVIIRSSDGTRFWDKASKQWGTYVGGSTSPDTDNDGITDYRTQGVKNPPFYISVIDGETGAEKYHNELIYSQLNDGGDHYSRTNRADYRSFGYGAMEGHYGIAYLDGIHPSLVMECADRLANGVHHVYILAWDFDWNGGTADNWHHSHTWTANNKSPGCAEFHQIRILDSDGDGRDELWGGGYGVNPKINRFHSTGLGHGDRFIISDIDPDRPGIEGFAIQQSALLGQCLYDAATGKHIKDWYLPSVYDVGRGSCMDINPNHKGYEIYSFTDDYIYNAKGESTGETRSQWGISTCFEGFWWNGDLLREELSSPGGSGWGTSLMVTTVRGKSRLIEFSRESGWNVNGATGTRPAFMGDIIGDWREEVILAKQSADHSTGLTGFSTNLPTDYSIYCLQQDPHYRGDCTTRGYYQHPNTGFYLGEGMPMPPLPPVMETDLRYAQGAWNSGSSNFTSFDQKESLAFENGKSVIFDLAGDNSSVIEIADNVQPAATYFMNPLGKDYTFKGNISGSGDVIKSQQGTVYINDNLQTTGRVIISEGTLCVAGRIAGPVELRAKGTLAGTATLQDAITFEGALNNEGCRLQPGNPMTSKKSMTLPGNVYLEIGSRGTSCLSVEGDLTFQETNYITIAFDDKTPGECILAQCTGKMTCDVANLKVRGLEGINYDLEVREDKCLVLVINQTRAAQTGVTWTGTENGDWDYKSDNFVIGEEPTCFVSGDGVIFPEEAVQRIVNQTDMMVTSGVQFTHNSGSYVFNGEGGFSGEGDLVMDGKGALTLNTTKSNYTGKTVINSGTVTVKNLENKGIESCFGAGTTIELGKAVLNVNHTNAASDRNVVLTDSAAINVPSGSTTSLQSALTGTGVLVKRGAGQLNLNYGGTNGYAGTILEAGTLSQGAWNASFGKSGSRIDVTGNATIRVFNNNSTSAVPTLSNTINVVKGKTLTINGGQRCKVQGKWTGEGTVKISFPYVRGDFSANLTDFEGTLNPTSGQFRIVSAMNMQKGIFTLGAGVYAVGVKSQSGTETSLTHKIGALSSTASDAQLGTSVWNVGYLGTNTTFAGIIGTNATLNKYGDGVLTLTGASTGEINIYDGEVKAMNTTASITTATITVRSGGTLSGTGQVEKVIVQSGGALSAEGTSKTAVGTLSVNGALTLNSGATLRLRTRTSRTLTTTCDAFDVTGAVRLNSPTIEVTELSSLYSLDEGAELQVFTGSGPVTMTGTVTMMPAIPKEGCIWDTSALASEGVIRVVADPTGIRTLEGTGQEKGNTTYDLSGRRIPGQPRGYYIRDGKKYFGK